MATQAGRVARFECYYHGEHPFPTPPKALNDRVFREACKSYEALARMGATNFVSLVADAPANRLAVTGFRFGETTSGDEDAWRIWQENHLDADSAMVHSTALATSKAYALVWWGDNGRPEITAEHPSQMIVAYAPGSRRRRVAALKHWVDDWSGGSMTTLYLRDGIYKWVLGGTSDAPQWRPREVEGEAWPVPNPLGVVPVVEFAANPSLRPDTFGRARSEFEGVLSIQDRINKTVFDRLVTAEFQAFRQRWVIGWEPPKDPEGKTDALAAYKASVARLLTFTGDDPIQVGEFQQADFTPFLRAVELDVQQMAAITETPPHYLLGQMTNISSDALIAAEAGLIAKTRRHRDNFSESWEEVMRLALAVADDPRKDDYQASIIWDDIEQRTWGQTVDAVAKMQPLGVPTEALWSMLPEVTPQDVARWRAMRATEALLAPKPAASVVEEEPASVETVEVVGDGGS